MHVLCQYALSDIYSLSSCATKIINFCHKIIQNCISKQLATSSLQASMADGEGILVLQDMDGHW